MVDGVCVCVFVLFAGEGFVCVLCFVCVLWMHFYVCV